MSNIYFDLTTEFNSEGAIVALASGQAVVFYRLAIMSKDGDWVVRESDEACEQVRSVLAAHGARHRPSPPLDLRWLNAGWSSHFEFFDERRRRIRCDFVSRPPRVRASDLEYMFRGARAGSAPLVVDRESLILMKQTMCAKDYAVIGELARQLPPDREIALTTDVDRIIELAPVSGLTSIRPAVVAGRSGALRGDVVAALAREIDELQQEDRRRVEPYQRAAAPYLAEFRRLGLESLPLPEAHEQACRIAEVLLPSDPGQS